MVNQRFPRKPDIPFPVRSRCAGICWCQRSCTRNRTCLQSVSYQETGTRPRLVAISSDMCRRPGTAFSANEAIRASLLDCSGPHACQTDSLRDRRPQRPPANCGGDSRRHHHTHHQAAPVRKKQSRLGLCKLYRTIYHLIYYLNYYLHYLTHLKILTLNL